VLAIGPGWHEGQGGFEAVRLTPEPFTGANCCVVSAPLLLLRLNP